MNIIEEQAKDSAFGASSDQFNLVPKGPKAKKVYSKPMLVVLLAPRAPGTKDFNNPGEGVTRGSGGRYSPS